MRIAAIFPADIKQDVEIDLSIEQALGIAYVAQAAKNAGHQVNLFYGIPSLEKLLDCDVLAFSSLTQNVPTTIDISRKVKKFKPEIITVVGGSHISGDKSLVLDGYIDYGVVGEGEQTFVELLYALEHGRELSNVKGIVYAKNEEVIFTGNRERLNPAGLRPMRVADFYGIYDASLYYPAPSERRFIPIIASRGCGKGCEFCDSELIWGKKIRYRTPADITSEIEELYQDENDVFMLDDDNFFLNRRFFKEILGHLIGKNYNLASCGDICLADIKILRLLKQAGWTSLLWGIESVNPHVLKKEKQGLTPEKIHNTLSNSERLGIFNHGMVMIGFDYETEESILKYGSELIKYPIHQLRLSIATPFIGTKFYERLKQNGHLFNLDLSKWDTGHLVYDHPTISPERMKELQYKIVSDFYSSSEWDKRMNEMARQFPKLRKSIREFRDFIQTR